MVTGRSPSGTWDSVPAANAIACIAALSEAGVGAEVHSFEIDTTVLEFALRHSRELGYLAGWEPAVELLIAVGESEPHPRSALDPSPG